MNLQLQNKVAIVTGGSGGLGSITSQILAGEGCRVVVGYSKNKENADTVARKIVENKGEAFAIKCDVSQQEEVQSLIESALERYNRIDILVNNAGILNDYSRKHIASLPIDHWDIMFKVHCRGAFLCTQAVIPHFRRNSWGRIINISSIHGFSGGRTGISNYASAKGAVVAFTKAAAKELGPYGITVNAVAPGFIDAGLSSKLSPELREEIIKQTPVGRLGRPDEIASLIVWLTSEQASYINGQAILCDGGREDYFFA